jgi:hypothetical protein
MIDDGDGATAARAQARRAGNLLHAERWPEALAAYDWVWRHLHHEAPDMAGVRRSFTASEIGVLCRQFAPAQAHFEAIRDAAGVALQAGGDDLDLRLDWMVLNEIVGQAERTLIWFDRITLADLPDRFVEGSIPRLVPLLRRRGRWAEIGRLFRDPLAKLRADYDAMVQANQASASQRGFRGMSPHDLMKDLFREQTHILVRSLRAAGRSDDAAAIALQALVLDDSPEMGAAVAAASSTPPVHPNG